jgi:hypothetical protein
LGLAHARPSGLLGFVDPYGKRFTIPQIHPHPRVARLGPQYLIDLSDLPFL